MLPSGEAPKNGNSKSKNNPLGFTSTPFIFLKILIATDSCIFPYSVAIVENFLGVNILLTKFVGGVRNLRFITAPKFDAVNLLRLSAIYILLSNWPIVRFTMAICSSLVI